MSEGHAVSGMSSGGRPRSRSMKDAIETAGPREIDTHSDVLADIRSFQASAFASSTLRQYETDWAAFAAWCRETGNTALPAEPLVVSAYFARAAKLVREDGAPRYATGTLRTWMSSINKVHFLAGHHKPGESPEVQLLMSGIARMSLRKQEQKAPLLIKGLRRTLNEIDLHSYPAGVIGRRDWSLLLFGFVGAYRRSELASFNIGDVARHEEDGLHIMLRSGKTDQEGKGLLKALPYGGNPLTCAPCAFFHWIRVLSVPHGDARDMTALLARPVESKHVCRERLPELSSLRPDAPLFRPIMKGGNITERHISGNVVNDVLKRRMFAAGFNPQKYGAHSLRAGFVTQAFRDGATHHEIMRQTGHKTASSVETYAREYNPLIANAVTRIEL